MKIGLLTYHSAYNFGSVLQAYATQTAIEKLGYPCEIINYRMKEQYYFYSLYRWKYGIKTAIKDISQIPWNQKRLKRAEKFEQFIQSRMHLSEEISEPEQVEELWNRYSTLISGSDQVWNKHSNELQHNTWNYMNPYLLHGFTGKKVSYASSIGNSSFQDLRHIAEDLEKFDFISLREHSSVSQLSKMVRVKISTVLDPTFLLNCDEWIERLKFRTSKKEAPYILFYSLARPNDFYKNAAVVKQIAQTKKYRIKVIAPLLYLPLNPSLFDPLIDIGPEEFLDTIYNAEEIITDSYHGTILSINFGKEVFSLCKEGGSEFRKTDILKKLNLEDRIIYNSADLLTTAYAPIDYQQVYARLESDRQDSIRYLENALKTKPENF